MEVAAMAWFSYELTLIISYQLLVIDQRLFIEYVFSTRRSQKTYLPAT